MGWSFTGRPRTAATSTTTSTSRSPDNSARELASTITPAAVARSGAATHDDSRREPVAEMRPDRHRRCRLYAREAGLERARARGRHRLSHLFHLCARTGCPLERVSLARPRTEGPQRGRASGGAAATNTIKANQKTVVAPKPPRPMANYEDLRTPTVWAGISRSSRSDASPNRRRTKSR